MSEMFSLIRNGIFFTSLSARRESSSLRILIEAQLFNHLLELGCKPYTYLRHAAIVCQQASETTGIESKSCCLATIGNRAQCSMQQSGDIRAVSVSVLPDAHLGGQVHVA